MTGTLLRLATSDGVLTAVAGDDDTTRRLPVASLGALWGLDLDAIRALVEDPALPVAPAGRLLPPVDGLTEVWAAGVTYRRSSDARQEESQVADVYARVYAADRSELFFKSPAWRVVGHDEPIGVRPDSPVNVPEPELALVVNAAAQVVGLAICNDVSSRSIEGENPLYLPQAKVYAGSCALGPGIMPIWQVRDPSALSISVEASRAGQTVWQGTTSTSEINRSLDQLVEQLFRHQSFPEGVVLSTGTGLVPELDFNLAAGDVVTISIDQVGTLRNVVRPADTASFGWLTPSADRHTDV